MEELFEVQGKAYNLEFTPNHRGIKWFLRESCLINEPQTAEVSTSRPKSKGTTTLTSLGFGFVPCCMQYKKLTMFVSNFLAKFKFSTRSFSGKIRSQVCYLICDLALEILYIDLQRSQRVPLPPWRLIGSRTSFFLEFTKTICYLFCILWTLRLS